MTAILDLDHRRSYLVCDLCREEIALGQPFEHHESELSEHDYHRRCVRRHGLELIQGGRA